MPGKLIAWIAGALVAALALGWIWGATGKADVEQARRMTEERADFASARAELLDGRLSLLKLNFGDAARHFHAAQQTLAAAQIRLRESQDAERAGRLEIVLAHVRDAEQMAIALKPEAQDAATDAVTALAAVAPR